MKHRKALLSPPSKRKPNMVYFPHFSHIAHTRLLVAGGNGSHETDVYNC